MSIDLVGGCRAFSLSFGPLPPSFPPQRESRALYVRQHGQGMTPPPDAPPPNPNPVPPSRPFTSAPSRQTYTWLTLARSQPGKPFPTITPARHPRFRHRHRNPKPETRNPKRGRNVRKCPEMSGNVRRIENSDTPISKLGDCLMRALRARIRALQRTLARELAVVRLRRLAEEFCLQSSVVQASGQPPAQPHVFIQRVASAGFRLPSFMAAHKYLERCRVKDILPDREDLLRSLVPWSRRYPVPAFWQG